MNELTSEEKLSCGHHKSLQQEISGQIYCELCYRLDCLQTLEKQVAELEAENNRLRKCADAMRKGISIEIYQHDWIPGFAAFRDDGAVSKGKAHVVLNLGDFLAAVAMGDLDSPDLPYLIAESLLHEIIHVLEAWAKTEFSEEKVEGLIEKYRAAFPREGAKHG